MSTESLPDRAMLEGKARDELQTIATALGVKVSSRARKADIVDAILGESARGDPTDGAPSDEASPRDSNDAAAEEEPVVDDSEPVRRTRRPKGAESVGSESVSGTTGAGGPSSGGTDASATRSRTKTTDRDNEAADAKSDRNGDGAGGEDPSDRRDKPGDADAADGEASPETDRAQEGNRSDEPRGDETAPEQGNRRRRRRGPDRNKEEAFQGEPVPCEGVLDLRDEGYGFLRTKGLLPSNEDVYVAAKQIRQYGLRRGDHMVGASRPATRNEKNPAIVRIDQVNGGPPEDALNRPRFDDLTPLYPDERLHLERKKSPFEMTGRIIDLIAPIGKGQRGLIVSPPKAGKTTVMKQIAKSIETNDPDVELIVLLIDERPEEVTDMRRSVNGEVVASTFDRPTEEHTQVAELTIERAKRMVESGRDVVVILDGITRLARAYNLSAPATGRVMSGGVDAAALYPPKKFFGAARNLEEGGSLTILATALVETGSRMDEVIFEEFKGTGNMELRLDRRMAERRIFPAIDVNASSTRHEELLFERKQLDQVWKLRRVLGGLGGSDGDGPPGAGVELLLERMASFRTNDEFLAEIAKS